MRNRRRASPCTGQIARRRCSGAAKEMAGAGISQQDRFQASFAAGGGDACRHLGRWPDRIATATRDQQCAAIVFAQDTRRRNASGEDAAKVYRMSLRRFGEFRGHTVIGWNASGLPQNANEAVGTPARPQPSQTRSLGTIAATALTQGKRVAATSANSAPLDAPHRPMRLRKR